MSRPFGPPTRRSGARAASAAWLCLMFACTPVGGDGPAPAADAGDARTAADDGRTTDMSSTDLDPIGADMSPGEADARPPENDMGPGQPDMAPPGRDMAPPGSDMAPADADAGPGPSPERCNGEDDDLDGSIDEGDVCDPCAAVVCPVGEVCAGGACAPAEPTPIAAQGRSIELMGALDDTSRRWGRVDALCRAGPDGEFRYAALRIVNPTDSPRTLQITGEWGETDGMLFTWIDPFAPPDRDGCRLGSDDFTGVGDSRIDGQPIEPGQVIALIVTTYQPEAQMPAFTLTVQTMAPIPERERACDDGLDEDEDGAVDCADDDCAGDPVCDPCAGVECGPAAQCVQGMCVADPVEGPTPIAAVGGTIGLEGALTADSPTWRRPSEGCGGFGLRQPYFQAFEIVNRTGAQRALTIDARWPEVDGFLHVFATPFDPDDPGTNCLVGNDDFEGAGGSRIDRVFIDPDQVLVVVASAFAGDQVMGPFRIDVTTRDCGPGGCDPCDAVQCGAGAQCVDGGCVIVPDAATPIPGPGGSVDIEGELSVGDPTWNRPGLGCRAGGVGEHHYAALRITNTTGRARTVTVVGDWGRVDGYLHAYRDPLDPDGVAGCLDASDDDGEDAGRSRLVGLALADGETRVLVVSTFNPREAIPAFTVTVTTEGEPCDGACGPGEACLNGVCGPVPPEALCDDGIDDDGDGLADCDDPDCAQTEVCTACPWPCELGAACVDRVCVADEGPFPLPAVGEQLVLTTPRGERPTWHRPTLDCGGLEDRDYPYRIVRLVNDGDEERVVYTDNEPGGFVAAYRTPFDVNAPEDCIAARDDRSGLPGVLVQPGEEVVVVMSTLASFDDRAYTLTVTTLRVADVQEFWCNDGVDNNFDGLVDCRDPDCGFACPDSLIIGPPGESVIWSGDITDNSPIWRPVDLSCHQLDYREHYESFTFYNNSESNQDVTIFADWGEDIGRFAIHDLDFDPERPRDCEVPRWRADQDGPLRDTIRNFPIRAGSGITVTVQPLDDRRDVSPFTLTVVTQHPVTPFEANCDDDLDDDRDGRPDCADPDCGRSVHCDPCIGLACDGQCIDGACMSFEPWLNIVEIGEAGDALELRGTLDRDDPFPPRRNEDCSPGGPARSDFYRVGNTTGNAQWVTFEVEFELSRGGLHLMSDNACLVAELANEVERVVALPRHRLDPYEYVTVYVNSPHINSRGEYLLEVHSDADRPREECDTPWGGGDGDGDGYIGCADSDCFAPEGPCPNPPAP